jgi:hypothetical protein
VELNGKAPSGADVVLVLGTDYKGLTSPASTAATTRPAGTAAKSSAASNGSSASSATSATAAPQVGC